MSGELAHLNPPTHGESKRDEIVAYIRSFVEEFGWAPSVRNICEGVGLSSPSTVHAHLETLVEEGRIVRDPTKPRAIRVVQ